MSSSVVFRRLLHVLRPFRGVLVLSTLCRLINQALGIALIVVSVWGLTRIVQTGDLSLWIPLALLLTGLGMLKGLFRYLEQLSGHYVAFRLLHTLRHRLYEKLEALAPSGLAGQRSGDFVARAVSDIERIEVFYAHTIAPVAVAVLLPAAILVLLWFCNARMALTVLPFVLVVGAVIPLLTQQFTRPAARDTRQHTAALTAGFTDSIQGVREILVFNWEHHQEDEIVALNRQLAGAQGRLAAAGAWQSGLSDFFIGAGIAAALLAGTMAVQGGEMSGWTFPPAMALALCIFLPLLGISNLIPDLDRALGSAGRIFEILDKPEPPDGGTEGLPAAGPTGVELQNVVFSYPGETEPVLRGVSLSLPPGKITAVVGESGAGKSTLVSLLLGFWTPQQGTIRIGPTDARFLAREAMREVFAVAPQRGHLFNTTLRENLLLARPAASAEDIESAARLAGIHDFIVSLPKGYDTPAQEAGQRFSGGQRQRLALARAFLKNAPVLILDEATAGLDLKTEAAILDNLRQWIDADPSRSALVITHRILGASKADSIAVLQSGKIVETGTHEELLERQGTYSALFRAQIETV